MVTIGRRERKNQNNVQDAKDMIMGDRMTKKMSDFLEFISYLKKMGYRKQIHINHLEYFIAEKFGVSKYMQEGTLKNLIKFGFLKLSGMGVFEIGEGWNPLKAQEETEKAEKDAEKEADALIKKMCKGKPEK